MNFVTMALMAFYELLILFGITSFSIGRVYLHCFYYSCVVLFKKLVGKYIHYVMS